MNKSPSFYRNTPVGEQLVPHFERRAELRRAISLVPSWREVVSALRSAKAPQTGAQFRATKLAAHAK